MLLKCSSSKILQYEIQILVMHRRQIGLTALFKSMCSCIIPLLNITDKLKVSISNVLWKGKTNIHGKSSTSPFSIHVPLGNL